MLAVSVICRLMPVVVSIRSGYDMPTLVALRVTKIMVVSVSPGEQYLEMR